VTITATTVPLLDRLLPLPLDQLILHEQLEPARLRAVLRNLVRTKIQNNPVLVTRLPDDRWLVIDGAHRVSALRRLGVTQALTQVISAGEYRISAWHHLIAAAPPRHCRQPDRARSPEHAGCPGSGQPCAG
jgi:ParB-like chromosome segregation protein Spo0J